MKLSVLTVPLYGMPAEEAFAYLHSLGVQQVELGCGGYPGTGHLDPKRYLGNDKAIAELKESLEKNELSISALSCHGNAVHPNREIAAAYHQDFVNACQLAKALDVHTIVTFSGCPGDCPESQRPNWVTCAWPTDYAETLEWQWNEVLIPYWKEAAALAQSYGVERIAFEMHPGFCVYNPKTMWRLREAVGEILGANFDPSHLIWQGMDPVAALRECKGALYHFHAKDTKVDAQNTAKYGVLDTTPLDRIPERSWAFRTIGYGTDVSVWKAMMSELVKLGYDGAVSIEHEDGLMTGKEGLEKAIRFLQDIMIFERNDEEMFWA